MTDAAAQDQIRAFVERIMRMREEASAINADIREIYAEAKGAGFDKTILGKLVRYLELRETKADALAMGEELFELYLSAYDGTASRPSHVHAREGEQTTEPVGAPPHANASDGSVPPSAPVATQIRGEGLAN